MGLDFALEALRDCFREHKSSLDEIWEAVTALLGYRLFRLRGLL
jgi:hypothetical protein